MSFSSQVKDELNSLAIKSNCCKKAWLFGACLSAEQSDGNIHITLADESTKEKLLFLLKTIYNVTPDISQIKRGCFSASHMTFTSRKLSDFFKSVDELGAYAYQSEKERIFACPACRTAFLRAVFCCAGSVSDPQKSYTLEIRSANEHRAEFIESVIADCGLEPPRRTVRKNVVGLFYRNESDIEDILTSCGGSRSLFRFFDVFVEKDLRNSENRATNCVARNISKSVEAAALQISAIEALIANGMFDEFSDDIKHTADLRMDNPDISLTELAAMHTPPISKSGLNHRLAKIVEEAKKRKLI